MPETFTKEAFSASLGSSFRLDLESAGALELVLVAVTGFEPAGVGARQDPFSVVFRGPHRPVLPQRIYRLEHERLGALEIFIVPIGPDAEGMRYEAVFN